MRNYKKFNSRRKLFFEFSWNVRRKKFFDQEKMRKIMQGELQDMLTNYTMNRNMEWVRQDTMEQISDEYMKTMTNIGASKRDILNKIDGLHILTIKGH